MPAINIRDFGAALTINAFDHNQGVEHPDASGLMLNHFTRDCALGFQKHHFKCAGCCYWQQVRKMILPYNSLTPNCYDLFVAD